MDLAAQELILTVNPGSSSLKLAMLGMGDETVFESDVDAPLGEFAESDLDDAIRKSGGCRVVAYRVVHGGTAFKGPARIDGAALDVIRALAPLAPLHQDAAVRAIDAVRERLPDAVHVACFDTSFHSTIPAAASTYAIPARWREEWGVRRFGFHGLSHAYASRCAAEMLGRPDLRLVTCHLGAGASLAAVRDGLCMDTTMGFTPLEGLVMANRSGTIDPAIIPWLVTQHGMDVEAISKALEHESGLKALAGIGEMQSVLERAAAGDAGAALARDVYVHRLNACIAAMAAALGGVDALVFTGGVGENSPEIRERAVSALSFLELDASRVLVIPAREDLEMARQARELLATS